MAAVEEEEVLVEVEAVQAVYGEDCRVIRAFPPHLDVHIRPRTADDSSQQFVEAVLGIRAGAQYPNEPPHIIMVGSKGLDKKRQDSLIASIQDKAQELSSCLMLVALCEEAVEILSNMNHPEGNCPLCLHPLVPEDTKFVLPFMKLMSCFHCFHSECIIRWWKWLQEQNEANTNSQIEATIAASLDNQRGMHISVNQCLGDCPVCRMVFHSKDIEHVADLLETNSSQVSSVKPETKDDKEFLHSDVEISRRQKFEAVLKLQQENNGLVEPRKNLVVVPGMFLLESVNQPPTSSRNTVEQSQDIASNFVVEVDSSSTKLINPHPTFSGNSVEQSGDTASTTTTLEINLDSSSGKHHTSMQTNSSSRRKGRAQNPRKQQNAQSSRRQWVKKEGTFEQ